MIKFWEEKTLDEMNEEEWESLCDGCAKCCLVKIGDKKSGITCLTNIACKLLDTKECKCTDYTNRFSLVPKCLSVKDLKNNVEKFMQILPNSCAYKLIYQGKPLYDWHHLISGDRNTIHEAEISVKDKVTNETGNESLMKHIVTCWKSPPQ